MLGEYLILVSPVLIILAGLYARFQFKMMKLEESKKSYKRELKTVEQKMLNQKLFAEEIIAHIRENRREYPELYEKIVTLQKIYKL